jgi:hypothetical protein
MRRDLAATLLPLLLAFGTSTATAQATASLQLPWSLPAAEGVARLEQAGFLRAAEDGSRYTYTQGQGVRRTAADSTQRRYTRNSAAVKESILLRTRGGQTVQMFYSAVGDSATLQARVDAVAAGESRGLVPGPQQGMLRIWQGSAGQRLTVPTAPSRLPDAQFQVLILYHRP